LYCDLLMLSYVTKKLLNRLQFFFYYELR
jgi:hypothetical protein